MRTGSCLLLGDRVTMSDSQPNAICGPETLKMLYGAYEDVVRLVLADRPVVSTSEDLIVRRLIGEVLLEIHSEGENNPIMLRRRALERFSSSQKRV